ncbi:MAG: 4-(cytidine 5'-diphospho)-2-C-methyl-D-erythritol kinase [Clostridia bacterium]|nr:4-(cytidine 5'-diphospho)-2-C-methyl-D-erythritol kinase [Clostridia bacterium]
MEKIKIKVFAKINLSLDITGVRSDGYHELDMLNTSVSIYDTISACKSKASRVVMDGVEAGENNTAVKALKLLKENFDINMDVEIQKGIPFSAGLGGSSADASGVFFCAHKLYELPLEDIMRLAVKVGCDVPYMLYGGGARVQGVGEIVKPCKLPQLSLVICQKEYGASTKEIYSKYDEIGSYPKVGDKFNALEKAAVALNPNIKIAKKRLLKFTDRVFMTGSGSAYVGVFDSLEDAQKCVDEIGDDFIFKNLAFSVKGNLLLY